MRASVTIVATGPSHWRSIHFNDAEE